jgi:uncharacterized protein (TIGR03437 family)
MRCSAVCLLLLSVALSHVSGQNTGLVSTIAGGAARGFEGDDGPATSAALALANVRNECDPNQFEQASHIAFDADGNLYIADSRNQRIRRIAPNGVITTVSGSGETPSINGRCESVGSIADGPAANARFYNPSAVVRHPNGNLIIADQWNNRIRQVTPEGVVSTIAGSGQHNIYAPGIPARNSPMDWPTALAIDSKGLIHFVELHGNRVGRIEADGRLSTVVGTGFPGSTGDGGQANRALLNRPTGIAFDPDGNLLIADTANHRIRKVVNGVISTVAGTGKSEYCGDGGRAVDACLSFPMDVKADRVGNVYIADTNNHRVRRIDSTGIITTIAGTGVPEKGADFVPPDASELNLPSSLAIDAVNSLFILDWQNYRIRKIDFQGALPVISSVLNTASLASPVAPGSLISIFGSSLSVSEETAAADAPWPTTLGGSTVRVNGVAIPIAMASPTRIDAHLPYDTATGMASLLVTAGPYTNPETSFEVVTTAPGLFTQVLNEDGTVNGIEAPAKPLHVIVCFLTGQGASEPPLPVKFRLGEVEEAQTVQSSAVVPGVMGLVRVEIQIPESNSTGNAVPLTVEIDGRKSNAVNVAIATPPPAPPE